MPHHAAFSAEGLAAPPSSISLFSTPLASATASASSSLAARSAGSDASPSGTASASAATRFGAPGIYPLLGSNTACEAAPPGAAGGTLPPARSGHSLVTLEDGTLLLFGGGPDENVCNDVYRVSVEEKTGAEGQRTLRASYSLLPVDHTKSRTPYERDRHSAWVYQGFMHVFGGEDVHGYMYSDIWMFDHNALTWHERQKAPRGTHPSPRRGQTCTAVGDTVWLFGGLTYERQSVSEVYTLNMGTMSFELMACRGTPPCGRRGHSATHLDGYLYIFGGCDKHEGLLGDLWRLHLTTLVWEKVHSYMPGCGPSPTVGHAAATFRGMLLTFGGNISSEKRASCSEIWMWDPKVGGWLQLRMKEEPRARSYHAVVSTPKGDVLAFGGWSGSHSMNDMTSITVGADGSLKHSIAEFILRNRIPYKARHCSPLSSIGSTSAVELSSLGARILSAIRSSSHDTAPTTEDGSDLLERAAASPKAYCPSCPNP